MKVELDRWVEGLLRVAATCCLIAIVANTVSGVVARYVFNASFLWTEQLGGWLFLWLVSVGAAANLKEGRQLKVDIVQPLLPPKAAFFMAFFVEVVVVYTLIALFAASYELVTRTTGTAIGLQVPAVIQYAPIPLIALLGVAYSFLLAAQRWKRWSVAAGAVIAAAVLFLFATPQVENLLAGVSASKIMGISFGLLLLLGVPIAIAMLCSVFLATSGVPILPPAAIVMNMAFGIGNSLLIAIPLFLAAGYLMNLSGLTVRLMDFANSVVGHLRGGLAQVNVLTSVMFGAMSGSSSADAAGTTKILVPEMAKRGYPVAWSCAVTASSSIMANVMPPAISMLLYAAIADVSVGRLFLAGIVPALTIGVGLSLVVYITSLRRGYGADRERGKIGEIGAHFIFALPAFVLPVLIIGGIRFGVVTPTEAGGIGVVWGLLAFLFLRTVRSFTEIRRSVVDCALDAASIGFLIAASVPFAWVLIGEQVPQQIIQWITTVFASPMALLLICIGVILVMGMVVEMTPGMLIAVPLLLPVAEAAGLDRIHFGVIVIVTLLVGGLTPPVGILVYVTSVVANVSAAAVFKEVVPFIGIVMLIIGAILAFPMMTLYLAYL